MKMRAEAPPGRRAKSNREPRVKDATQVARRLPIGAEVLRGKGTHFRVWAPACDKVGVQLGSQRNFRNNEKTIIGLERDKGGYFSGILSQAVPGMLYKLKLNDGCFPDPASRFQPEGPHGPSQIVDPDLFQWNDQGWRGVAREGQVIYEMHIGTFTPEGTWAAAMKELGELAILGITAIEVMPVADFPGRFGWGYDGVNLFAPSHLYGSPDDFRAFVDWAHRLGMGVILDVVYNHVGPDGNYLREFSPYYFTDHYKNEWGQALNFDDEHSGPVRELFLANAEYWIREFHLDGLRLDATQQIFDSSREHILRVIARKAREAAGERTVFLVGENECQHANLVRSISEGGYGLDALWNDDLHHSAMVALTGRNEAYFSDHRGMPQEFIAAVKYGFLYQGQWYSWQKQRRGTPAFGVAPCQFVAFIQNHDQVANTMCGYRVHQLTSPGRFRAITAFLLLIPSTPMLFQGQEFGASAPFLYFADHAPELARLVTKGRREFLKQFGTIAGPESEPHLAEPESEKTFLRCKLDFSERKKHEGIYNLHKDLLKLRREDPVFSRMNTGRVDGAVLGPEAFVLRLFGDNHDDRLLLVNLGLDLELTSAPEPLLAPPHGCDWQILWSSESLRYGGCGTPLLNTEEQWRLLGHSTIVLAPEPAKRSRFPKGIAV